MQSFEIASQNRQVKKKPRAKLDLKDKVGGFGGWFGFGGHDHVRIFRKNVNLKKMLKKLSNLLKLYIHN